jgi:hypothetical protein
VDDYYAKISATAGDLAAVGFEQGLNQGWKDLADSPINTPEFQAWFGTSKVVDESGKPLVVYKGMPGHDWDTGKPFTTINRPSEFPAFNRGEPGVKVAGFFSSSPDVASRFATGIVGKDGRAAVYPVYLKFESPYVIDAGGVPAGKVQFGPEGSEFREAIRSGTHDGVIIRNTSDEGDIYVALKPEQIKSAVGNRGTFDPKDPNILNQGGEAPRGRVTFSGSSIEDGKVVIQLFQSADASTLFHESSHIFRRILPSLSRDLADKANAFVGATKDKWTRSQEEQWATAFERYLSEGVAPAGHLDVRLRVRQGVAAGRVPRCGQQPPAGGAVPGDQGCLRPDARRCLPSAGRSCRRCS